MENPFKIIFFGDSIAKAYSPLIEEELNLKYPEKVIDAVHAGISGETTRDGLLRMSKLLEKKPQVIIISFGMNDWRKNISLKEYVSNVSRMIIESQKVNIRVILVTINPDYRGLFKGSSQVIDTYNVSLHNLARKYRIKLADVNALWKKRIKPVQKGLRDAIHPNNIGKRIYCESLMHVIPQAHTTLLWQYNGRECHCNYKCPYCYYASSPKTKDYFFGNIDQWRLAFKDCFGKQSLIFYLAFGEPMIGEHFYDVVKMIGEEPEWKLRITSNISQDLKKLVNSRLAQENRLFINASFHPSQISLSSFLEKLLYLRKHGIESPVIYVMYPPHLERFEKDFQEFEKYNFLVHVRRFQGNYKGRNYPDAYSDEERRFIAKYADDGTIKYMLNHKMVENRDSYSGLHFYVVDCTGNIGYDSNCFDFHTKYRTIFGNILQDYSFKVPLAPTPYPKKGTQGTVDGVSNYLESGYRQLENNNILDFARQGGVYHHKGKIIYKHKNTDFTNSRIRAEYNFPPRHLKDEYRVFYSLPFTQYIKYCIKRFKQYRFFN